MSQSDDDKPRKASEVLLGLERKFDLWVKIAAASDTNTKLLLNSMNKACALLERIEAKLGAVGPETANQPTVETFVSEPPIVVESEPKGSRRTARPETYEELPAGIKVVPIQQKVYDPTGKAVFMAEVEVYDENKNIITKLRTTAAGKWQVPLAPGKYFVSIFKRESGARKRLDYQSSFIVTESTTPIELEPARLA